MKKEFLTTGKIAEICEVNYRTVCKWINDGKLKAFGTPGGHNRVEKDVFLDFCKQYHIPIPEGFEQKSDKNNKKRILIVDDDKKMVKSIKGMLLLENKYNIAVAYDGFSAGKIFSEFKPDLVTLDIRMPKLDGFEVCEQIRKDSANKHVKIIIISGFMGEEEERKMKEIGADACMRKPFNKNDLISMVAEKLKGR